MQTDLTTLPEHSVVAPMGGRNAWELRVILTTIVVLGLALSGIVLLALRSKLPTPTVAPATTVRPRIPLPVGIADAAEPSGMAPPAANALAGYHLVYVADFQGRTLPSDWDTFSGVPGGTDGQFAPSHVVVANGMLQLHTYQDPVYGDRWTSGGLCQCGRPFLYGAFFVRERITGPGTNEVNLLWPFNNVWPPEVDFDETGVRFNGTSWTVHPTGHHPFFQRNLGGPNLTQWHTFGVIWTPTSLTFTIDGNRWGTFRDAAEVPHQLMTLDLEQRPACRFNTCTAAAQSLLVDWVAEYRS